MPEQSAASLYCDQDAGVWDVDACRLPKTPSSFIVDSHSSDEFINYLRQLIESESDHIPHSDYLQCCHEQSVDITARQDSINWILKVHEYYKFRPVTAILSVNYLDRFLSTYNLPQGENGWPFQLLSVACLSLAAKMEELQVPPLLDLQVSEPKFVFEPKTVQRMELLVLDNLKWRLRSVTPFDFVDHFISNLPSSSSGSKNDFLKRVFSVSSDLILSTTRVIDFLGFPPSAIAAAAVISAASKTVDLPASFYEIINRELVRSCHQLMEEYLIDTCPSSQLKDRDTEPVPPASPVGVLDAAACGSCDTRGSSSQAEPPTKRLRSSAPDVQQ